MTLGNLIQRLVAEEFKSHDIALAILWWHSSNNPLVEMSSNAICNEMMQAGLATQNVSRTNARFLDDKRVVKGYERGTWRLQLSARKQLSESLGSFISTPKPIEFSDSVLPRILFKTTRGYIERVVDQINASYDSSLFDCCAVMCRRLIETLIIEVYESRNLTAHIKGIDGNYLMLAGLVTTVESDVNLHIGRSTLQGLKDFKKLGDSSAHNRRFNARKEDIDRVRDGLRYASEELLHLAKLV
jgi:hypothetical protein